MNILELPKDGQKRWNSFVGDNFPPIGGFMQTWEWGEFQKSFGRKVERYFVTDDRGTLAAFTLVIYDLRLGYTYGYMPRGPVVAKHVTEGDIVEVFGAVHDWLRRCHPELVFCRMEPPLEAWPQVLAPSYFHIPSYYIQPRRNLAISLEVGEIDIQAQFHASVRSNISRAVKRGASVIVKEHLSDDERTEFYEMMRDTIRRNSGKNVYPSQAYFEGLFRIPFIKFFCGYQDGQMIACHVVIYFGATATYLYGAAYTKALNSKVTTLLHWEAMQTSKKLGFRWYDIGGIDAQRWPSLTDFKRRFHGNEFNYIGNVDVPLRPILYKSYNLIRKIKVSRL